MIPFLILDLLVGAKAQICIPTNAMGWEHGWLVCFTGDIEIDHLRKRLEETEAAMERIVAQMGSVPHKLHSSSGTQLIGAKVRGPSSLTFAWHSAPFICDLYLKTKTNCCAFHLFFEDRIIYSGMDYEYRGGLGLGVPSLTHPAVTVWNVSTYQKNW